MVYRKIKAELSKAKYVPYKGRTKYYEMIEDLLKEYQEITYKVGASNEY